MPVYNGALYLKQSIESILEQTISNFEFIIINDCSTDNSLDIINAYAKVDPRIKVFSNSSNLGLVRTLNYGIELCNGEYIARMDADDISMPDRLQKQVAYLKSNTDIVACGTAIEIIDGDGIVKKKIIHPVHPDDLKSRLFFYTAVQHPSVMIRSNVLNEFLYSSNFTKTEDYELWNRIVFLHNMANLEDFLLKYRVHGLNVSVVSSIEQKDQIKLVQSSLLKRLNFPVETDMELHFASVTETYWGNSRNINESGKALHHIVKIWRYNRRQRVYSKYFDVALQRCWY